MALPLLVRTSSSYGAHHFWRRMSRLETRNGSRLGIPWGPSGRSVSIIEQSHINHFSLCWCRPFMNQAEYSSRHVGRVV